MKNLYETLELEKSATTLDIKKAYKRLAKQYHPDLNKDNIDSAQSFREVNEAYKILSEINARKKYDEFLLKTKINPNDTSEQMFQDFFSKKQTMNNIVNIKISILESILGIKKTFHIQNMVFTILLHKGTQQYALFSAKDLLVNYSDNHKDITFRIIIIEDEKIKIINNNNLLINRTIDLETAIYSDNIGINIFGKRVHFIINKPLQCGSVLEIKNHGLYTGTKERGSLLLKINISIPRKNSLSGKIQTLLSIQRFFKFGFIRNINTKKFKNYISTIILKLKKLVNKY